MTNKEEEKLEMKKTRGLFLFVLMVCGCATTNFAWKHSLYIDESTFMRDKEECAAYAERVYATRRAAMSPYLMSMGLNMMASQPTPYPQTFGSSIGEAALKSGITQMPVDTSGDPFDNCMYAKGYYKVERSADEKVKAEESKSGRKQNNESKKFLKVAPEFEYLITPNR